MAVIITRHCHCQYLPIYLPTLPSSRPPSNTLRPQPRNSPACSVICCCAVPFPFPSSFVSLVLHCAFCLTLSFLLFSSSSRTLLLLSCPTSNSPPLSSEQAQHGRAPQKQRSGAKSDRGPDSLPERTAVLPSCAPPGLHYHGRYPQHCHCKKRGRIRLAECHRPRRQTSSNHKEEKRAEGTPGGSGV